MNKIILIVLCVFCVWIILNYIILIIKQMQTMNMFKKMDLLLIKKYTFLTKFLSNPDFSNDKNVIEICKYLNELVNLPQGCKFINRKLALNYIISNLLEPVFKIKNIPDEYKLIKSELENYGVIYNNNASKLKYRVEIFPTSIIARLLNIKTVDFYRG